MSERQVDLQGQGYLRDSAAIYERSFAIIRAEADLARFSADQAEIAIRMIHACGAVQVAEAIVFSEALVPAARGALRNGAALLCDSEMVAHGITRARLLCFICLNYSTAAHRSPRRSSAFRSASSVQRKQKRRLLPIHAACPSSPCVVAWAEAPWPRLRSMRWQGPGYETRSQADRRRGRAR